MNLKLIKEAIRLPQKLTIPAETRQAREELLKRPVPPVTNAVTQQFAVDVGREIRLLENSVEKLRKDMTKPLRDLSDQINKICGDYSEPLTARRKQLQDEVNAFVEAEEKRVQLETAARLEELKRLQAPVETNGDVSQQELTAYRNEQQAEELMRAPFPEVQKASGAATRKDLGWECTDPIALWNARPDLCNPPTPKASAIRALCVPEMPVIGLKLWWEKNTTIRTR